MLAIDDPYVAWCFDEACMYFGSHVEEAMEGAKGKKPEQRRGNAENILRTYLGLPKKFKGIEALMPGQRPEPAERTSPNFRME